MSSGPGLYGDQDTVGFEDLGYAIRKQCYFHSDQLSNLTLWVAALRQANCILYDYTHTAFDPTTRILTFERPKVIGTLICSLDTYDEQFIASWDEFTDRLVNAGDQFEKHGIGYIHVEPKELHNYIVDHNNTIQALDIETSFMVVHDRKLFKEYAEIMREMMRLELRRYVTLRKIENNQITPGALT